MYKSLGQGLTLTNHSLEMSSDPYTKNDLKRIRECSLPHIVWEDDGMSLPELYTTSKKFKAQVEEHNERARLLHLTNKLKSDIPDLHEEKVCVWLSELTDKLSRDILPVESIVALHSRA